MAQIEIRDEDYQALKQVVENSAEGTTAADLVHQLVGMIDLNQRLRELEGKVAGAIKYASYANKTSEAVLHDLHSATEKLEKKIDDVSETADATAEVVSELAEANGVFDIVFGRQGTAWEAATKKVKERREK